MPEMSASDRFTCYLAGSESLLQQCGERLLARGHEILGVISADRSIRAWASESHLQILDPDGALPNALAATPFDYFFSITNLRLLPADIIRLPRRMAINFHDGPLPRFAGLHATSWAIFAGATDYAITWHRMTPDGVDDGDILWREPVGIDPDETAFTLNAKCYEAGIRSFDLLVDLLAAGRVEPRRQDLAQRTYFGRAKRPAGAASIRWDEPADRIAGLVRGLEFGPYPNPLALPKLWHANRVSVVGGAEVAGSRSGLPPGTVVAASPDRLVVATATDDVLFTKVLDDAGLAPDDDLAARTPPAGASLRLFSQADLAPWTTLHEALTRHEGFWVDRLAGARPIALPVAAAYQATGDAATDHHETAAPAGVKAISGRLGGRSEADTVAALLSVFLARVTGVDQFDVAFADATPAEAPALFSTVVPWRIAWAAAGSLDEAAAAALTDLDEIRRQKTFAHDIAARYPALRAGGHALRPAQWPVRIAVGADQLETPAALVMIVHPSGASIEWRWRRSAVPRWAIEGLARQFDAFMDAAAGDGQMRRQRYPLQDAAERDRLLVEWNDTDAVMAGDTCVHTAFESQAARTPDTTAVIFERQAVSYGALNARANRLAARLRSSGVEVGHVVALAVPRSVDLVVAAIATLKAGAAYLPLDPEYPVERLKFMLADSGARVLLGTANPALVGEDGLVAVVPIEEPAGGAAPGDQSSPAIGVSSTDLAYVIYTSGSTGKPKGVMVEHRQVMNFFAGMDGCVPHEPPGVWLAVTSLSFDISVLELFWTLARGFTVVIQGEARNATAGQRRSLASRRAIDLSLFYFASDAGGSGKDKYELLIEGAKFADREGFLAVWTPERHFHAFGGLYPNPSVASAAIAAITTRVGIRAGSVVLPLHHPIRVAEEWALVDNLSGGRVGISFASGWHPEDFVLRPETFADAKTRMMRDIEVVRRLWRGERVAFPGPLGKDVEVSTLPRPVQPELPVWVTAAGNPETFRMAGEAGCFVLTHLLGQSVEELAGKLEVYRRAWRAAGHGASGGRVTLMLHTFVGESDEKVRQVVREPMKHYLSSAVNLIKQYAWSFPAFRKRTEAAGTSTDDVFKQLSAEDLDALVEHAFERYYETSGLFGTVDTSTRMIDRVKAIGVEEVACLIDFGVPPAEVLAGFERLAALRREVAEVRPLDEDDHSIPATIERHGVTHMQCTPSLAGLVARDPDGRLALGRLSHLLVGGEALPAALAASLAAAVRGSISNMYGPTETTIWSAVHPVSGDEDPVPIGRPIANTRLYILDADRQPVPVGAAGELYIGGAGVARGYLGRPELTAERFIDDPFRPGEGARMYRTGDLARYRPDGSVDFLGRIDHQVKIRGFRVELGEIESLLTGHAGVAEAVVLAREDQPGDVRLVAYVTERPGAGRGLVEDLRAALKQQLPDYMVPAHIVRMAALPMTPNGKVNRAKLPLPESALPAAAPLAVAESDLERTVASIWQEVLQVPRVGVDQNFFDLGGHSLLTVRVLGRLRETTGQSLPITDMFRFPTVRALARHLGAEPGVAPAMTESDERAASRREMMARRRRARPPSN